MGISCPWDTQVVRKKNFTEGDLDSWCNRELKRFGYLFGCLNYANRMVNIHLQEINSKSCVQNIFLSTERSNIIQHWSRLKAETNFKLSTKPAIHSKLHKACTSLWTIHKFSAFQQEYIAAEVFMPSKWQSIRIFTFNISIYSNGILDTNRHLASQAFDMPGSQRLLESSCPSAKQYWLKLNWWK